MFRAVNLENVSWINKLKKAFTDYYGEERVAIVQSDNSYEDDAHSDPYIAVYFPDVDIKRYHHGNDTGKHHRIKDLFMFIGLDLSHENISNTLKGLRTTFTLQELCSAYSHSHLRSTYRADCHRLHDFCTGTGSIRNTMGELSTNRISRVDEDLLTMFAFQLDMLVPVESVDGVPYNSLTNIGNRARASLFKSILYRPEIPIGEISANELAFIKYLSSIRYFKFFKANGWIFPHKDILTLARELSTLYIQWLVNSQLPERYINRIIERDFVSCKYDHCGFSILGDAIETLGSDGVAEGTPIIEFNGKTYNLVITREEQRDSDLLKILRPSIISEIFSYVYKKVNVYGE